MATQWLVRAVTQIRMAGHAEIPPGTRFGLDARLAPAMRESGAIEVVHEYFNDGEELDRREPEPEPHTEG